MYYIIHGTTTWIWIDEQQFFFSQLCHPLWSIAIMFILWYTENTVFYPISLFDVYICIKPINYKSNKSVRQFVINYEHT